VALQLTASQEGLSSMSECVLVFSFLRSSVGSDRYFVDCLLPKNMLYILRFILFTKDYQIIFTLS
jgi:hypothetical protein